jgi:hypothetical protein
MVDRLLAWRNVISNGSSCIKPFNLEDRDDFSGVGKTKYVLEMWKR